MNEDRQELQQNISERIYEFLFEIAGTELKGNPQSASICSQACLFTAVMILEGRYGKPPPNVDIGDEAAMAIAKKMSEMHNDLVCRFGELARKNYNLRISPTDHNGCSLN